MVDVYFLSKAHAKLPLIIGGVVFVKHEFLKYSPDFFSLAAPYYGRLNGRVLFGLIRNGGFLDGRLLHSI